MAEIRRGQSDCERSAAVAWRKCQSDREMPGERRLGPHQINISRWGGAGRLGGAFHFIRAASSALEGKFGGPGGKGSEQTGIRVNGVRGAPGALFRGPGGGEWGAGRPWVGVRRVDRGTTERRCAKTIRERRSVGALGNRQVIRAARPAQALLEKGSRRLGGIQPRFHLVPRKGTRWKADGGRGGGWRNANGEEPKWDRVFALETRPFISERAPSRAENAGD